MKPCCILDASALLAWMFGEPGKEVVTAFLDKGCGINVVNWAETLQRAREKGVEPDQVYQDLHQLNILHTALHLLPFTEQLARQTALLRQSTKKIGLSLGDRACLATALEQNALEQNTLVLTADRIWHKLEGSLNLQIQLIR